MKEPDRKNIFTPGSIFSDRLLENWSIFKENLLGKIGLTLLIIFAFMAVASFFTPLIDPMYNPMTGVDPNISYSTGPSLRHWLGVCRLRFQQPKSIPVPRQRWC